MPNRAPTEQSLPVTPKCKKRKSSTAFPSTANLPSTSTPVKKALWQDEDEDLESCHEKDSDYNPQDSFAHYANDDAMDEETFEASLTSKFA